MFFALWKLPFKPYISRAECKMVLHVHSTALRSFWYLPLDFYIWLFWLSCKCELVYLTFYTCLPFQLWILSAIIQTLRLSHLWAQIKLWVYKSSPDVLYKKIYRLFLVMFQGDYSRKQYRQNKAWQIQVSRRKTTNT